MQKLTFALLFSLLPGCFDPLIVDSQLYRCSADAPLCPSGKLCRSNCCLWPDETTPPSCQSDDAGVSVDASTDLTTMSTGDMAVGTLPANCAYLSGTTAFVGCVGKWASGAEAKSLCPVGYTLCDKTKTFPSSLGPSCTSFIGTTGIGSSLWLTDTTVSIRADGSLSTCGFVQPGESAGVLACGQAAQKFNIGCGGFLWGALSNKLAPLGISGAGGATSVVNNSVNNGVLCCR